jgi:hypothetical protein
MALTGTGSGVVTGSIVGTGNFYPDETLSITTVTSLFLSVGDADITAITTYYGDIAQNIFTSNGTISVNTLSCTGTGAFFLCSLNPIGVTAGTSPEFSADVCSGLPGRWAGPGLFAAELVMTASSAGGPGCQPPEASSAPQIKSIDYGNEEIYLTVSVSNNGGSIISTYTATCTDGTTQYTGTSSTSRITVSGLTNGVGYSCSVKATNAAGTSTASASSPPIVPEYIPVGLPIWLLYEAVKSASP